MLQRTLACDRWQDYKLIFPSSVGTPGDPSNLRNDFLKVLERAGLPKIRFHDLRHTAALMLSKDVPVITVSKRLGHSRASITLDVYAHLIPGMQSEVAELIDEIVMPIAVQIEQ